MKFRFPNNCLKAHFELVEKKCADSQYRVKWSSVLLLTVTIILPFYTVGDFFFFCLDVVMSPVEEKQG